MMCLDVVRCSYKNLKGARETAVVAIIVATIASAALSLPPQMPNSYHVTHSWVECAQVNGSDVSNHCKGGFLDNGTGSTAWLINSTSNLSAHVYYYESGQLQDLRTGWVDWNANHAASYDAYNACIGGPPGFMDVYDSPYLLNMEAEYMGKTTLNDTPVSIWHSKIERIWEATVDIWQYIALNSSRRLKTAYYYYDSSRPPAHYGWDNYTWYTYSPGTPPPSAINSWCEEVDDDII